MKKVYRFYLAFILLLLSISTNAQNACEIAFTTFKNEVRESKDLIALAESNPQETFDAWKILQSESPSLRTSIEELNLVSKNLNGIKNAGGYIKWKTLQVVGKHANWVEITGITNKVEALTPHVLKVETNLNGTFISKSKTIGTTTFNMEGFKGCHTENALKD